MDITVLSTVSRKASKKAGSVNLPNYDNLVIFCYDVNKTLKCIIFADTAMNVQQITLKIKNH